VRKERPDEIPKRPQKRLYTLKEAAEYLGRSDWAMRELMWKGAIPYVRELIVEGKKMQILK
jgi:hypothetical protein